MFIRIDLDISNADFYSLNSGRIWPKPGPFAVPRYGALACLASWVGQIHAIGFKLLSNASYNGLQTFLKISCVIQNLKFVNTVDAYAEKIYILKRLYGVIFIG